MLGMGGDLGDLMVHLKADTAQFTRSLNSAKKQMEQASIKMQSIGRKMSMALTMPLVGIGAAAVKSFASFDQAMTKSLSIMGDVSDEMRSKMEQTARDISTSSVTSMKDLADAYYYLASAGMNAKQSVEALAVVERFSVAGAFDMAKATDLLTDAQSALGLSSKDATENMKELTHVSDVLVRASIKANATVEQFAKSLTNKAAAATRDLGKSVEETTSVLMVFADQGVKGLKAGEYLARLYRDLQKAAIENKDAWDAMGLSVFDTQGKMLHVADIIKQMEGQFGSMSDEQKKTTSSMLGFREESLAAIQALLGNSDKMREFQDVLEDLGITTEDIAEKQMKSFSNQMKNLWNNINDVAIDLGRELVPIIKKMATAIKDAIKWWKNLDESTKNFIVDIGKLAVIAGPALIVLGKMTSAISMMGKVSVMSAGKVGLLIAAFKVAYDAGQSISQGIDDTQRRLGQGSDVEFMRQYERENDIRIEFVKKMARKFNKIKDEARKNIVKEGFVGGEEALSIVSRNVASKWLESHYVSKKNVNVAETKRYITSYADKMAGELGQYMAYTPKVIDPADELKKTADEINKLMSELNQPLDPSNWASQVKPTFEEAASSLEYFNETMLEPEDYDGWLDAMNKHADELSNEFKTWDQILRDVDLTDRFKNIEDSSEKAAISIEEFTMELEQSSEMIAIFEGAGDAVGSAFERMVFEGTNARDSLRNIINDISQLVFRQLVTQQITSFVTGGISSLFGGGPSAPVGVPGIGTTYGPPTPTASQMSASTASGSKAVNVSVYTPDADSFRRSKKQIGAAINRSGGF